MTSDSFHTETKEEQSINRSLYWTISTSAVLALVLFFVIGHNRDQIRQSNRTSVITESAATAGTTADFGGHPIEKDPKSK